MAEADKAADSGTMTNAENAYFKSGGEKTEGLDTPAPDETKTETAPAETQLELPTDEVADNGPDEKPDIGEDGKPRNKGQWVRYGALHAEREQGKALKAENARLAEERARFDERLRILQEAIREPEAPAVNADPEPDPEQDFIAHQKWVARQVKAEREARLHDNERRTTEETQRRAEEQVIASANSDALRFAEANPDFGDAYNHLLNSRAAMYMSMGYTNAEINRQMRADEVAVYTRARERGVSAAEMIYNLSKTVGYKKGITKEEAGNLVKSQIGADDQPHAKAEAGDVSGAAESIAMIDRINKGLGAAKTLTGAGGSPVAPLSAEALANMSNEDFNAFASRHPRELKRIMGG